MINFILVHIGDIFPEYIYDCINQIYRFNKSNKIFLLMNNDALQKFNCNCQNLIKINIDDISKSSRIKEFDSVSYLSEFGNDNFWNVTCKRLFYVEEFMKLYNIENVIHIENDVLVYEDFSKMLNIFGIFFHDKLAINPVGPKHDAAAFIYIHKYNILKEVNDLLIHYLKQNRGDLVNTIGESLISEMILLRFISKTSGTTDYLPLTPDGEFSKYLNDFGSCFDCASWGQFLGGTPSGHPPGFGFSNHWLGNDLNNKKYEIVWKNDELDRKTPYISYDFQLYKLNNIHVHCKKLKNFI